MCLDTCIGMRIGTPIMPAPHTGGKLVKTVKQEYRQAYRCVGMPSVAMHSPRACCTTLAPMRLAILLHAHWRIHVEGIVRAVYGIPCRSIHLNRACLYTCVYTRPKHTSIRTPVLMSMHTSICKSVHVPINHDVQGCHRRCRRAQSICMR